MADANWWDNPLSAITKLITPVPDATANLQDLFTNGEANVDSPSIFDFLYPKSGITQGSFLPDINGPSGGFSTSLLKESGERLPGIPSVLESAASSLNYAPSGGLPEAGNSGFWSGLGDKIEAGSDWMDKHKAATSAGVSALAFLSSLPASKRAAAMQKMMFEQDQARQAAVQAQMARNNAPFSGTPFNRGTPVLAPGMGTTNYSRSGDPRYRNADIYGGLNRMNFTPKA